jgi:hypothetical protein
MHQKEQPKQVGQTWFYYGHFAVKILALFEVKHRNIRLRKMAKCEMLHNYTNYEKGEIHDFYCIHLYPRQER